MGKKSGNKKATEQPSDSNPTGGKKKPVKQANVPASVNANKKIEVQPCPKTPLAPVVGNSSSCVPIQGNVVLAEAKSSGQVLKVADQPTPKPTPVISSKPCGDLIAAPPATSPRTCNNSIAASPPPRPVPGDEDGGVDVTKTESSQPSMGTSPLIGIDTDTSESDWTDCEADAKAVQASSYLILWCMHCLNIFPMVSSKRNLPALMVTGSAGPLGSAFYCCRECRERVAQDAAMERRSNTHILQSACQYMNPEALKGSRLDQISEAIAGRPVPIMGDKKGGTAVVDAFEAYRKLGRGEYVCVFNRGRYEKGARTSLIEFGLEGSIL